VWLMTKRKFQHDDTNEEQKKYHRRPSQSYRTARANLYRLGKTWATIGLTCLIS
jgi:hypothetical protein